MAKILGLQRKGDTYYLRVRVPKDVQAEIGKGEIVRSLKTKDLSEAKKRIYAKLAEVEAEFDKIRKQRKAKADKTDMLAKYSDNELMALAGKWFNAIKAKQEHDRMSDTGGMSDERKRDYNIELKQEEWQARQELLGLTSPDDKHDGMTIAGEFLANEGVSYDSQSDKFRKLGYFFSKAIHEFQKQCLDEFEGRGSALPTSGMAYMSGHQPTKVITMDELVREYLEDPKAERGESAMRNYRILERAIKEIIGADTPVHQVTREDCKKISALFLELPKNVTKLVKSETLAEAVEIGKKKGLPKLAAATYNNYMQNLSAIMDFAVREMYIAQNPAKKLGIKDTVKKKDKRNSFKLEQLRKIFGSNVYIEHRPDALRFSANAKNPTLYGRYWIPLIALWTGMRLNEICQLYVEDITEIDDVPVILIRDTDDDDNETEKRVKTENGIRFVPIHPMLIRMGLLDFVKSVRKTGETRLFPHIKLDSRGYYSHYFSKRFSDHLRHIGAKTAKTSFYSLRHTYRDAIRTAKLSRDATLALGGWASDNTDEQYGDGLSARELYTELCNIKYDGLDLTHLYK